MNYEHDEARDAREPSTDDMSREEAFALAVGELSTAKSLEASATARRIDAEARVLAFMPWRDEGAVTAHVGTWKVSATYGVNRTVDAAAMEAVRSVMPPALFEQAVTYKPALVLAGVRYLQSNEPDAYALLAQAITAKPAKPSVRIEPANQES
jgi:hypothetical protein